MQLGLIIALAVTIPVVLFPAAFVWYLNIDGMVQAMREARAAREKKVATAKTTG
ncbi:MAG: hypothetical protein JXB43_05260 [Dehalococcoidia bacterium]|nr:hypothetical protein [Dehalococcoidia bacterium]